MTLTLARAVIDFHFSFGLGNRRDALVALHRAVLQVEGHIATPGEYHGHLAGTDAEDGRWRPAIIEIASRLKFEPGMTAEGWLTKARAMLGPGLVTSGSISQRLRSNPDLAASLASPPLESHPARTIHSAKGMEFAAVCVVILDPTLKTGLGTKSHDCLDLAALIFPADIAMATAGDRSPYDEAGRYR